MKYFGRAIAILGITLSSACSPFGAIPMIGNKGAKEINARFKKGEFEDYLTESLTDIHRGVFTRLNEHESRRIWTLKQAIFGLGIQAKADIGVVGVTGDIGIRVVFSKIK
ncbi:MAG: hypothetical protein R3B45_11205 [Bdellovibrionota bacterium]